MASTFEPVCRDGPERDWLDTSRFFESDKGRVETDVQGSDLVVIARRILVIGAAGFVGRHLMATLEAEHGPDAVFGAGKNGARVSLDLLDGDALRRVLREIQPSHVVNLAGIAAPGEAASSQNAAWSLHLHAVLDLGRALLEHHPEAWLVQVGSGLAYGRTARHGRPLRETDTLEPLDIYGASKAAGDLAIGTLLDQGLRVVRLRPFNHTGPGQSTDFAVPAFAQQIAQIEAGLRCGILSVGNLDSARDFLDVRDVADAYAAVIRRSDDLESGSVFNVASGHPIVMRALLDELLSMSAAIIEVHPDPARQRPGELTTISGDASALKTATGWAPSIGLNRTLRDVLDAQRVLVGTR